MATQSLYRRYRPRRFSELKGQDHVVRALRTSVAEGREGQAYLFSGPRGTGKTTSARILAKVLNCENPQGGEPCCECPSCLSVEQGTSYDVHELDAASNNGVDAMRDLIEKASLGTPGRHKVYILDEVHMLSRGAEAALLKTLEEPPPHVVFVLATTDPQKMSDTIRSRTQHLQFHLLPADTLDDHVRWVAADAGLAVTDEAIEQVLAQGAGSARDTLSALELVANSGGAAAEIISLDEFAEAMIEHEPGRALTMAAHAISRGRDPRTLTEELIGFLRNGFLSLMAPELVQLPSQRLEVVTDLARRVGPAGLVRGIEHLGSALTEMRHAPDPRVILDVAIVQLTSEQASTDLAGVLARLQQLERRVAEGVSATAPGSVAPGAPTASVTAAQQAAATAPPADPTTGRAPLGGRAKRAAASQPAAEPTVSQPAAEPTVSQPDTGDVSEAGDAGDADAGGVDVGRADVGRADVGDVAGLAERDADDITEPIPTVRADEPARAAGSGDASATAAAGGVVTETEWEQAKGSLRGIGRALFAPARFVTSTSSTVTLGLPNASHRDKCEQHRVAVEKALVAGLQRAITLELVVDGPGGSDGSDGAGGGDDRARQLGERGDSGGPMGGAGVTAARSGGNASAPADGRPDGYGSSHGGGHGAAMAAAARSADPDDAAVAEPALRVVPDAASGRQIAEEARRAGPAPDLDELVAGSIDALPDDDEIDLDDLVDAPPEAVKSPIDRLAEAFPGSELIDDIY